MADTPKLSMPEITESQASKYVTHNEALRIVDGLVQANVKDKDLIVPPSSPSDGDTYIVGTPTDSTSGDWNSHDDDIAYYKSSGWNYWTPEEGWTVYVQDEGIHYVFYGASVGWLAEQMDFTELIDTPSSYASGDGGKLVAVKGTEDGVEFVEPVDTFLELTDCASTYSGQKARVVRVNNTEDGLEFVQEAYDVSGFCNGKPAAGEVLLRVPFTRTVKFLDDMLNAKGMCTVAPGDSGGADFAIKKDGVQFGTMSIAQGATTATFSTSSSGEEEFTAGEVLTVEAPDPQDSAMEGPAFMFWGTRY